MKIVGLVGGVLGCCLIAACSSSDGASSDGGPGGAAGHGGTGGGSGGGGAGASCASATPCGGDVLGTWTVTGSCLKITEDLSATCAGESAEITIELSGSTITFNADLTYAQTTSSTSRGTTRYGYPASCLNGQSCTALAQTLLATTIYDSVTCTATATGGCTCDAISLPTTLAESGTYTTSGTMITTTNQAGSTNTVPYCASGAVLYEFEASNGIAVSTGAIELRKQ